MLQSDKTFFCPLVEANRRQCENPRAHQAARINNRGKMVD
jgi:hypothetical protein